MTDFLATVALTIAIICCFQPQYVGKWAAEAHRAYTVEMRNGSN